MHMHTSVHMCPCTIEPLIELVLAKESRLAGQ